MSIREDIDNLKVNIKETNELANEVAKKANKDISVAKCKITCLTILAVLFAILGVSIAIYSIHSMKELFYDMEIVTETEENDYDIEQSTTDGGNNYFLNESDNNKIGE